jgi:uncharacterized membrane protein
MMFMKKSPAKLMLLTCMAAILISCKHDVPVVPPPTGSDGVCFENDILPIFQSSCAKSNCHDATSKQNGYQLDTYANIVSKGINAGNASSSKIYEVLTDDNPDKLMPKSPNSSLTTEQKSLIATWINEGAKNTSNCAGTCDSSNFTYSGAIQPILQTHCLGCHSGLAIDGGFIPLDNYDGLKEQATSGALYAAITQTGSYPMPKNGSKLNDCKIALVRKWIEAGAPNN